MSDNLAKLEKTRQVYKSAVEKVETEIKAAFLTKDYETVKLLGLKNSYVDKIEKIKVLDEKILDALADDDFDKELHTQLKYHEGSFELLALFDSRTMPSQQQKSPEPMSEVKPKIVTSPVANNLTKLPRLVVKPFDGKILNWQSFWDQFSSAVDQRSDLTPIEKFNYLKSLLTEKAEEVISGLSLRSDNYISAVNLLKERFGNKQAQINAHMERMLKLVPVKTMGNVEGLRKLFDKIESSIRNLDSLGVKAEMYGALLIPIVSEKLPDELRLVIGRQFKGGEWQITEMMAYFKEELLVNEAFNQKGRKEVKEKDQEFTCSFLGEARKNDEPKCLFCRHPHPTFRCRKVTDINARKRILKKGGRCYRCLEVGHMIKACTSNYTCKLCNGKHNITICASRDKHPPQKSTGISPKGDVDAGGEENKEENATIGNYLTGITATKNKSVLLMTARSKIQNIQTRLESSARILFDTGSQRTYVTEEVRAKLKLQTIRKERILLNTFGRESSMSMEVDVVQLLVVMTYIKRTVAVEALCVPLICPKLHNQRTVEVARKCKSFDGLYLADFCNEDENGEKRVDILVGDDYFKMFLTGNIILGEKDEPWGIEMFCGWVLSGGSHDNSNSEDVNTYLLKATVEKVDTMNMESSVKLRYPEGDDLKRTIEKFWAVENVPEKVSTGESEIEELDIVKKFEEDVKFNGERYSVKLPLKPYSKVLPDNHQLAMRRLQMLKGKLKKDPELRNEYNKIIEDYKEAGIVETVKENDDAVTVGKVHCLSHHAVVKRDRDTTKVRIVFDGSAKASQKEPSLNECLYAGPCMLPYIFDIFIRFRVGAIAVIADVKQAFLQIEVATEHRDLLRFLWPRDIDDPFSEIETLRFCRVLFGLNCSPWLLAATINHHMKKYQIKYEDIDLGSKFIRNLYVDDTPNSFHKLEVAEQFYKSIKQCMEEGGFQLRKWESNSEELRKLWGNQEDEVGAEDGSGDGKKSRNMLGVSWDTINDYLVYEFRQMIYETKSLKETKRNMLKVAAMFYDPLGLICPVTLQPKLLFKQLWIDKLGWDEAPPEEISKRWKKFLEDLSDSKFEINRHVQLGKQDEEEVEIHGFADASKQAYAAAVYIRVVTPSSVTMNLLAAKSKVAPMKELTIPRLELLSNLLLSKLIKGVKSALSEEVTIKKTFCWTDSEIAYYWITQVEKEWKPWVENRVNRIRRFVSPDDWRHIQGSINPADLATREISAKKLVNDELWWHGPPFLQSLGCQWPEVPSISSIDTTLELKSAQPGRQSMNVLLNVSNFTPTVGKVIDIERYSSLGKLLRVTAYVLRFVRKVEMKLKKIQDDNIPDVEEEEITTEEIISAEELWIISEQSLIVKEEKFDKRAKSLKLHRDERGIIRSRTRINENYGLIGNLKYPILLREKSRFTKLLVLRAHDRVKHLKVDATLNEVRKDYWIIRGRQVVKKIIDPCVICKLYQGKTMLPPSTPDLPKYRVAYEVPFEVTGADYAGPVYIVTDQGTMRKYYILLFTCAATRCVHLEITSGLDADPLILALRRFTARRGISKLFISDNFKTFKSSTVKAYLRDNNIKWQFILDKAPNWGGFYERLIGLTKMCLKKTIGKARLSYEEFSTVLVEVENVLNSRPLTYLSEENYQCSLTPNHLVYGRNINERRASSPVNRTISADDTRGRLKHLRTVLHQFQNRFYHEYIVSLREKHQYTRNKTSNECTIKEGDVVLIEQEDATPRIKWKKGKIEELIIGNDGLVRGAVLRTFQKKTNKTSLIKRPLQKLIPLEVPNVESPGDVIEKLDAENVENTKIHGSEENCQRSITSNVKKDKVRIDDMASRNSRSVPRRNAAIKADLLRKLQV